MDITPVGPEIKDGVAHDLPRAVIGDVATAARLMHVDPTRREQLRRGYQVCASSFKLDAKSNDVRVLEQ